MAEGGVFVFVSGGRRRSRGGRRGLKKQRGQPSALSPGPCRLAVNLIIEEKYMLCPYNAGLCLC